MVVVVDCCLTATFVATGVCLSVTGLAAAATATTAAAALGDCFASEIIVVPPEKQRKLSINFVLFFYTRHLERGVQSNTDYDNIHNKYRDF